MSLYDENVDAVLFKDEGGAGPICIRIGKRVYRDAGDYWHTFYDAEALAEKLGIKFFSE